MASITSAPFLLTGGTIITSSERGVLHNGAVLVQDGRIAWVGLAADAHHVAGKAHSVDITGMTLLPGLIDAHAHVLGLGESLETVDLTGTNSYAEVIARVEERARQTPKGEWISGRGWDQNDWLVKEFPTARELDRAVPDHPVVLSRVDGHAIVANSRAMQLAGVNAATPDPSGGKIIRDAAGRPTGVFIDTAENLINRVVPPPGRETVKRRILRAAEVIASTGLTEVHDAGVNQKTIDVMRELADEKRLPIRVYAMLSHDEQLLRDWFARPPLIDYGDRLTVRSVKMYADGALGSRGAALLERYSDDPANSGLLITSSDAIRDVASRARAAGYQVNTHAIGDRGVGEALDAYEAAGVTRGDRFRIEHLQVIAPSDVPRLSRSGIIASMQPTHATSDMPWAEARLGAERVRGAYAWRTVLESGARLAFGSDFPVEAVNPFLGIYAAVTRQDATGNPAGGWYPQQRLSVIEAIEAFTRDAAYAAFEEDSRGTIEPGKLADLTLVDGNLTATSPANLLRTKVRMTMVGGQVVAGDFGRR